MTAEDQNFRASKYTIIPRVLIFSTRGDKLLLLKGSKHKKIWPNLYNGIGGHIEKGENVFAAAQREFFEETGLVLIDAHLSAIITIDTGHSIGIGLFVFKGQVGNGKATASKEGTLEWVQPENISKLPLVEDLITLTPKILNWKQNDPILYGQYTYKKNGKLKIEFYT